MARRVTGHPLYSVGGVTVADTSHTITGDTDETASLVAVSETTSHTITPPSGEQPLKLVPSGATSASTSVGGALNVDNSDATGAGVVIFSSQGATASGRLLVVRATNAAFPQQLVRIENAGTGHAVSISHTANDSTAEALDIVSTNPLDTTVGVSGMEEGRGTIKVTHNKPTNSDANASVLSLRANGAGTACQGIFFDSENGATTGHLLNFRQNGSEVFVMDAEGRNRFTETTDPSAPAANKAVLYARDNGAGKTQLCVRFATGAVQVLATEP